MWSVRPSILTSVQTTIPSSTLISKVMKVNTLPMHNTIMSCYLYDTPSDDDDGGDLDSVRH
eukprot:CAMPEP_0113853564 /NCGR_PEP_ID=MMETSP0372-20130328/6502_1 /TAXON_ID=340204 /ORGANISM="Lankesteria abbotti" /LENGTH=60 /DNA_ID=CAMNT_0000825971 /DNA_START=91 /DNA_END=270 /DNA_ORIENTATION=+ /assembly_acc=CAM_ASM_000359